MESYIEPKTINPIPSNILTQIGPATKALDNQPAVTFFFSAEH